MIAKSTQAIAEADAELEEVLEGRLVEVLDDGAGGVAGPAAR